MADSESFSALRVRGRLENIARTIAEARVTGDVYASLDTVEHAILAVMDEVADMAQAVADLQTRERHTGHRVGGWMRRVAFLRSQDRA